jgi:regulator of sigma E protease
VAYVRPGSPADRAGIQPGDRFQAVNGQPVADWGELLAALANKIGQQVTIQLADGEIRLDPLTAELFDPELYRPEVFHATGFVPLVGPEVRKGPVAAIGWGVRETTHFIIATYGTLKGLLFRTVSPTELHGPVGITQLAIKVGRQDSIARFVYFMAMISVSLAVVNFLPIPVVDGGHAVLLGIEKIRGKPVPVRIMNAVQMAGLALLLLVFVAITWNDVARILRQMW